jgi:hypothetical protein
MTKGRKQGKNLMETTQHRKQYRTNLTQMTQGRKRQKNLTETTQRAKRK